MTPATIPIPKVEVPLTVPSSSVTFEREFKRSKSDEELLYKYMKVSQTVNPFHATDLFLYPMKKSENLCVFFMFSGDIERDQWHEMV